MALTQTEQVEVWDLIKQSPLVSKWSWFRERVLADLDIVRYEPGATVFRPQEPPLYLYVVVEGTVVQRLTEAGKTWLELTFKPGQFLGQHALFADRYDSVARVTPAGPARLLRMSAAHLRIALEHNAALYEALLHDNQAARLRRIPLFRSLTDEQVRRLAEPIEERMLAPQEVIPLREQPGIWLVEWGQITVTGPADIAHVEGENWRVTAGNFFVALGNEESATEAGQQLRFHGKNTAANSAQAHINSHLFYLPAAHAGRLIATFPDMARLLQEPLPIYDILAQVEQFGDLTPVQRQHLAQFCGWEFVPAQQNITTQGVTGNQYIILRKGAALVTALDDSGRERPKNRMLPVRGYGATSLLEGRPRDATVRAVQGPQQSDGTTLKGADIVSLDRRDMRYAFDERPNLWTPEVPLVGRTAEIQETKIPYDWMQEGEVLKWRGRSHWFWLVGPILPILIIFTLLLLFGLLGTDLFSGAGITAGLLIAFIVMPVGAWIANNYFDDYYAVTNRRVTRRDHQVLLYQSRVEAPVEMIQDVTVQTNFWGRVFTFGDVTIRTAAKVGSISFRHVPEPDVVKEAIEEQRIETLAAARGRQKEELRHGLMSGLKISLPVAERSRALGNPPRPQRQGFWSWLRQPAPAEPKNVLPTAPRPSSLFRRLTPERWREVLFGPPPPPPKTLSGDTLWRKHWVNLVARAGLPFLSVITLFVLGVLLALDTLALPAGIGLAREALFGGWFVLLVSALAWFFWNYIDYRNDVYVVTDDRIMDIEMKPLGLFAKRREGGLDRVQNVVFVQNGLIANILNYGDVVISTAAADEGYTFLMVPNPKLVQATVFQKLDAFRARQEQKRTADRQRELIEGLEVYHRLMGRGSSSSEWGAEQ
jgi:CRP-like cAMP-binding protein/uncharacterized membrane protein YdbT with pleckstrin-like domain